ncbi:hypothetical protein SAZ11_27185 [Streptomyces sp. FXJ1.4098]|nr:hypothetical protein [Streptomyces sp. FXJ1.4098]
MSDTWTWDYDPDAEHVVGGLPHEVVAEVERLAEQLTVLGRDAIDVGRGNPHGGGCGHRTSSEGGASSCSWPWNGSNWL